MSKLIWDKEDERFYQTGIDQMALYVKSSGTYQNGVAWSGVSGVTMSPSGAESNKIYADNIEYLNLISAEQLGLTITAYDYPDEFAQCDGTATPVAGVKFGQQARKEFGIAYRTRIGTNEEGDGFGYMIHLVYNCKAAPSERAYNTVNESPEAIEFSWSISTTKTNVEGYKPVASIDIDSRNFTTTAAAAKLKAFEEKLWGRDADTEHSIEALEPTLPDPLTVVTDLTVGNG